MSITVPDFIAKAPLLHLDSLGYDLGPSLILAPHPDDESLGCGGLIAILRKQGIQIIIAFITDGSASHPNSHKYPPKALANLRKQEAVAAAEQLGVHKDQIHFFDQPDGKLANISEDDFNVLAAQLQDLLTANTIQSLLVPYQHDAHSDHRATWKLAMAAAKENTSPTNIVEYPIWFWKNGSEDEIPDLSEYNFFRLDISSVARNKKLAIAEHESQTTRLIDDDPQGFMLTQELLEPFTEKVEYYFFRKRSGSSSLSQNYFDRLYDKQADPWNFQHSAYEHSKYEATLDALNQNYGQILEIGCSIGVLTERLASRCDHLLAVDISEAPLNTARERCAGLDQVDFVKMDISKNFPKGIFDLIIISEVGYYLSETDLHALFKNCADHLDKHGQLIMVHWTSFVSEYPLTGKEVHKYFENSLTAKAFTQLNALSHPAYELVLWEKCV